MTTSLNRLVQYIDGSFHLLTKPVGISLTEKEAKQILFELKELLE